MGGLGKSDFADSLQGSAGWEADGAGKNEKNLCCGRGPQGQPLASTAANGSETAAAKMRKNNGKEKGSDSSGLGTPGATEKESGARQLWGRQGLLPELQEAPGGAAAQQEEKKTEKTKVERDSGSDLAIGAAKLEAWREECQAVEGLCIQPESSRQRGKKVEIEEKDENKERKSAEDEERPRNSPRTARLSAAAGSRLAVYRGLD